MLPVPRHSVLAVSRPDRTQEVRLGEEILPGPDRVPESEKRDRDTHWTEVEQSTNSRLTPNSLCMCGALRPH
jgi:hypothetical protein